MPTPAATFNLLNNNTAPGATQYKAQVDANSSVTARIGDIFAPHAGTTPSLNVYLDPGFILSGTTLTEVGTHTTATFSATSTSATVANAAGISGTMWIADNVNNTYIPAGTTATISGTTLTLSNATLQAGTNVQVTLGQISASFTAPVGNPRIDRVVVNSTTGAVSVITGTPAGSPTAPALTAGVLPVAQILLQTSTVAITNSMITDERAFGGGAANNTEATVASASTTDLGATNVNAIYVTGTTTITSFGSNGLLTNPFYRVRFAGALTLTNNNTSLILPGANNIVTIPGDSALFQSLGSGNWKCIDYNRFSGAPVIEGPTATIASASTTDLGSTGKTTVTVSGTTTITSLGSGATLDNPLYFITFSGSLTLTYNATSLIVPGTANIITQANDTCVAQYLGSGNWQVLSYSPAVGVGAETVGRNPQSSTYAPLAADRGKIVDFTGSSSVTWTMTSAATLGAGWYCYLRNSGTSNAVVLLQSSSGTIDGIAAASGYNMYSGEMRLITSDGTNFYTNVISGGSAVFTGSGSWYRPPGYNKFFVEIISGGGSGAVRSTSGLAAGGGGGGTFYQTLSASAFVAIASAETVTVAAAAASVASSNANGIVGNHSGLTINGVAWTTSGSTAPTNVATANGPIPGGTGDGAISSATGGIANYIFINDNSSQNSVGGLVTSGNLPAGGLGGLNCGGGGASSSTTGGTRNGGIPLNSIGVGGVGGANTGGNGTGGTAPGGGGGGAVQGGASGAGARGQVNITGLI